MLFSRGPKIPPPRPPDLPFDDDGTEALGAATAEARAARAGAVRAEHLLYALLRAGEGVAARALARTGLAADEARTHVERLAPPAPWGLNAPVLPLADDLKGAIDFAMREARAAGVARVGPGELLLGVLQSPRGAPFRVLGPRVGLESLRAAIAAEQRGGGTEGAAS
jgi:ATP-dependent Clp protease ATP-binding subunit ClpA